MPSLKRTMTCLLALTLTLSSLGCSQDKHVFVSTVNQPTTVVLLDTYKSEAVWEMDIPVNHKLVLDFEGAAENASSDGVAPSWVEWKLYRADDLPTDTGKNRKGSLVSSDRVDLTGSKILMQASYRPSPELPGTADAAPVPVQKSSQAAAEEAIAETKAIEMAETEHVEVEEAVEIEEAVEVEEAETMEVIEEANDEAIEAIEEAAEEADAGATEVVEEVEEAATTQPTK